MRRILIDTLTKDGRNLFDFMPEPVLRDMVMEAKQVGLSTALSGHLKLENLDELARINPDIVGVRGAVCSSGERDRAVAWEAVAYFKEQLETPQDRPDRRTRSRENDRQREGQWQRRHRLDYR